MIVNDLFNLEPLKENGPYDLPGKDYDRPGDTPRKRPSGEHNPYPYSPEEDDDYFREIFRKKREAAAKEQGMKEAAGSAVVPGGAINPDTKNPYTYAELRAKYAEPEVDTSAAVAPAGETPEQARIRKQKAAVQSIDNPAEPSQPSQPAPGANPFGAMAGQLGAYAPPQTTNTGGTLKQTPTGQVHTSSATNPNAQTNPAPAVPQAVAPPPSLGKQSDGKDIKPGQKFDTATGQPLASGATTPASTTAADTTTTAPVVGRVGAPAGRQAVDQAVATVKTVRSDRREPVIKYGKQQFDALAQQPVAPVVAPAVEPTATQQPLPQYTTKLSPDATVSTTPPASTGGTYDKKTGQAKVGNVGQTRLTDLPPEVQRRIQQQLSPVAEALIRPVTELLQQAESKEDIQRIKQFVDQQFVKYGVVSESVFAQRNQLINYIKEHSHKMAH